MCWSTYRAAYRPVNRTTRADRPRTAPDVRVGDAERDETIKALSHHTGAGRLTLEEFEERVDEVLHARTQADLRRALRELPQPIAAQPVRERRVHDPRLLVRVLLAVAAIVVLGWWVVWLAIPLLIMRSRRHRHHHWHELERDRRSEDDLTLV